MTLERMIEKVLAPIRSRVMNRVAWKELNELSYWKRRKAKEGVLSNKHYAYFYTEHFGFTPEYYVGKAIMDIGCGPRGSLEWADGAARRVGLDPLAERYLKLGADQHTMEYIAAPSEAIPFPDASFAAVFSFNSLDHVEDIDATISEIKRVVQPGGVFLLLVDVNHEPTDCEPHNLSPAFLLQAFAPEFEAAEVKVYEPMYDEGGMYGSIKSNPPLETAPEAYAAVGYLSVKFTRQHE